MGRRSSGADAGGLCWQHASKNRRTHRRRGRRSGKSKSRRNRPRNGSSSGSGHSSETHDSEDGVRYSAGASDEARLPAMCWEITSGEEETSNTCSSSDTRLRGSMEPDSAARCNDSAQGAAQHAPTIAIFDGLARPSSAKSQMCPAIDVERVKYARKSRWCPFSTHKPLLLSQINTELGLSRLERAKLHRLLRYTDPGTRKMFSIDEVPTASEH